MAHAKFYPDENVFRVGETVYALESRWESGALWVDYAVIDGIITPAQYSMDAISSDEWRAFVNGE